MSKEYFENGLIRFFMWPELTLHGGNLHSRDNSSDPWKHENIAKSNNSLLRGLAWLLYPLFRPIDLLITAIISKTTAYKTMKQQILINENNNADLYISNIVSEYESFSKEQLVEQHKTEADRLKKQIETDLAPKLTKGWQTNPDLVGCYCCFFEQCLRNFIKLELGMVKEIESAEAVLSNEPDYRNKYGWYKERAPERCGMWPQGFKSEAETKLGVRAMAAANQGSKDTYLAYAFLLTHSPLLIMYRFGRSSDFFKPENSLYQERLRFNGNMRFFYKTYGDDNPLFKELLNKADERIAKSMCEDNILEERYGSETLPTM